MQIPRELSSTMPPELLRVPAQVQEITGIEVVAQPHSDQIRSELPHFSRAAAMLDIDPDRAAITIWYDPTRVTTSGFAHELIHLRRNIVESVPKLFPWGNCDGDATNLVLSSENELEHLILVPEQLSLFPESKQWWLDHYAGVASRSNGEAMTLIYAWSFIRNVLPEEVEIAQTFAQLLRKYNYVKPADYFREDMKQTAPDKLKMILKLLQDFPGIKKYAGIGRYVMDGRQLVVRPVHGGVGSGYEQ